MNKRFLCSLLLSTIIHSFILMKEGQLEERKQNKSRSVVENKPIPIKLLAQNKGDESCIESYMGIGVVVDILGRVNEVAKDGPADKAGIRIGDSIEGELVTNKYKEGAIIEIVISRNGILLKKSIRIEKICTNGGGSE